MGDDWTNMIAAERMELDQAFADEIEASSFNRQQWGLVMTALEFDIENPSDPANARIVPDTSSVPAILPELDNMNQQGPMGGQSQSSGSSGSSGGIVDSVMGAFGIGGGNGDDERLEEATELAEDYGERLQEKLESKGRWESICERARD